MLWLLLDTLPIIPTKKGSLSSLLGPIGPQIGTLKLAFLRGYLVFTQTNDSGERVFGCLQE